MATREVRVRLPTLHEDQVRAYHALAPHRYAILRCGRRWGKTRFGVTLAADAALRGAPVGWFAPEYSKLQEPLKELKDILAPATSRKDESKGLIECLTGGQVDFWTLNDVNAGRSRKYGLVLIDEAAFGKRELMMEVWRRSIKPTLLDFAPRSRAVVLSNSAGMDPDNFFYQICTQADYGFTEYHAPTRNNPHMPAAEIEEIRRTENPLVFQQEYEAEFVDWSGDAFFQEDRMLGPLDEPYPDDVRVDAVFAIVDTAVKTKKENDGTAVVYFGLRRSQVKPRLYVLDWDYDQIQGDLLATWLPGVFRRCEELAARQRAGRGVLGTWIEDKASGMVLLQHARRHGWPVQAIDGALTAQGKVERAVAVSRYAWSREVGIVQSAWDKVVKYKGATRNHLRTQISSFRVDDKEDRDDDLLDCWTYGISIGIGDSRGF